KGNHAEPEVRSAFDAVKALLLEGDTDLLVDRAFEGFGAFRHYLGNALCVVARIDRNKGDRVARLDMQVIRLEHHQAALTGTKHLDLMGLGLCCCSSNTHGGGKSEGAKHDHFLSNGISKPVHASPAAPLVVTRQTADSSPNLGKAARPVHTPRSARAEI